MKSSKKAAIIIIIVIGIGVFGYSQYVLVSQITVEIIQSNLLEETEKGSTYDLELRFDNPSLLVLTAGETDFFVIADEQTIGEGKLEPFVLPAMGSSDVNGQFISDYNSDSENDPVVRISGVTTYDVLFASIDVPFVYYPSEEQAREFIHQN